MERVFYGDNIIDFILERKNVKNINLTVRPNLEVYVSANDNVSIEYIKDFVESKGSWIIEGLDYYRRTRDQEPIEKRYIRGETFKYLGRKYKLEVLESRDEGVIYYRGKIYMYIKDTKDTSSKKNMMEEWYKSRAKLVFLDTLNRMSKLTKEFKEDIPNLTIKKMKRYWGSCYVNTNRILLNSVLIMAPRDCIDYVVLHELVHFKHRNHQREFYKELDSLMPDWKARKKILDEEVAREL